MMTILMTIDIEQTTVLRAVVPIRTYRWRDSL